MSGPGGTGAVGAPRNGVVGLAALAGSRAPEIRTQPGETSSCLGGRLPAGAVVRTAEVGLVSHLAPRSFVDHLPTQICPSALNSYGAGILQARSRMIMWKTMMVTFYWIPSAAIDGSTAYAQSGQSCINEFVVGKEWWPPQFTAKKKGRPGGPPGECQAALGFRGPISSMSWTRQARAVASSWACFNASIGAGLLAVFAIVVQQTGKRLSFEKWTRDTTRFRA